MSCRFRLIATIAFTVSSLQPTLAAITDNLAGYWTFDETSGGIAHEASGNGQNGTLINFPGNQGAWTAGRIGGALEFGGPSFQQYVHVPAIAAPNSMTLSAWVWADSAPPWASIASANWNGAFGTFGYMFGGYGWLNFYFSETVTSIATGSENSDMFYPTLAPPLSLNAWHHVAVTVDVSDEPKVRFWRDGQALGSFDIVVGVYSPSTPSLNIGGGPGAGSWDGKIDDLGLWTRALSPAEISSIYNAGLAGQPAIPVPEPSIGALCSLGFIFALLKTHRRRIRI